MDLYLEIAAVLLNLIFLILLIREVKSCWFFGIAASLLSVILFYNQALFSESILYGFYALIGVYGWLVWQGKKLNFNVQKLPFYWHAIFTALGSLLVYLLGNFMQNKDASMPFQDAFSTVFSVLASFLEIYKFLSAWIYWIILNAFSIYLYATKGLWIYAALMGLYFMLSIYGMKNWSEKYRSQN